MDYVTRSPRVVGTHFFAKYGYDESMKQVSANLMTQEDEEFWKSVVDILDELQETTRQQQNPCAALQVSAKRPKAKKL